MRRDMSSKVAGACIAAALALAGLTHAFAASAERPAIIGMIEQDFDGFFLVVTNGNGQYDIFQKVDDGLGVSEDANVVCMVRDMCYLEVAHMPPDAVGAYGTERRNVGGLRQRLTDIRNTYKAMHAAAADQRDAGIEAWRQAIGKLATCFESSGGCP